MDMYVGEPPTTSSCISLNIPKSLEYGTELEITGSVSLGTINALAMDISDGTGLFYLTDCGAFPLLNISADLDLPYGTYDLTAVDWTDHQSCLLLVEQTITINDPIIEVNTSTLPTLAVLNETELELVVWIWVGTGSFDRWWKGCGTVGGNWNVVVLVV